METSIDQTDWLESDCLEWLRPNQSCFCYNKNNMAYEYFFGRTREQESPEIETAFVRSGIWGYLESDKKAAAAITNVIWLDCNNKKEAKLYMKQFKENELTLGENGSEYPLVPPPKDAVLLGQTSDKEPPINVMIPGEGVTLRFVIRHIQELPIPKNLGEVVMFDIPIMN